MKSAVARAMYREVCLMCGMAGVYSLGPHGGKLHSLFLRTRWELDSEAVVSYLPMILQQDDVRPQEFFSARRLLASKASADVNAAIARYMSTDFIVSDVEGNWMHCTTKGNITYTFLRLEEGFIYSVKNFVVQPNKDDFRLMRNADFILEFDGATTSQKAFVKSDGFIRYPFQLVDFDSLEPINNKYLIGKEYSVEDSGQSIRVTLWGGLSNMLIKKRTRHVGLYPIVLTVVSVKLYSNRLYLSSTSLTLILDDDQIPVSSTFHCEVTIDKIRTREGWNYPSCSGEKCKNGIITRKEGPLWCDSCNSLVEYPVLRYRLELICQARFTGFRLQDEEELPGLPPALANIVGTSHTLELKSYAYYEHGTYESFTCWKVVTYEKVEETASSIMVATTSDSKAPREELEDSDTEESFVAESQPKGGEAGCSSDTRKRKRIVMDDSE
ncbi:ATP-dependent DNA helicase PIF1-like protein [Tanacetum coccineum]